MVKLTSDIAFTPAVKRVQELKGSRASFSENDESGGWHDAITEDLAQFISQRDSFYFGTASADGQPYIQHRGGKEGFLKVLGERTLAFADFEGNRQYISSGNLTENDKAYIFLMDYPNRRRIKMWGNARLVERGDQILSRLTDPDYGGIPEQAIVFELAAWDVNCQQHITPRFTEQEIEAVVAPLKQRIAELEAQLFQKA